MSTTNTNHILDRAVFDLLVARNQQSEASAELSGVKAEIAALLKEHKLDLALERATNQVEVAKTYAKEVEDGVRTEALRVYELTANKQPHPAIVIKVFQVLNYDEATALEYSLTHLPQCVKLDAKAFEKVAKALPLDFVTESREARATIATDLTGKV